MQFDAETQQYLSGDAFSNSHRFRIRHDDLISRNELLVELAAKKRVLHVGCADHLELISQKRRNNTYLHDLLMSAAVELTGLDTNAAALSEMRRIGIPELFLPHELPTDRQYDVVLAPDVIEHVPNVEEFLLDLRRFGAPLVVTTPNALRLQNRVEWRHEFINTDHRYWFSPYTLAKSMAEAGYRVEQIWYTDAPSARQPVRWLLAHIFPTCRDGLAALATPM